MQKKIEKTSDKVFDLLKQNALKTKSAKKWGRSKNGCNQGVEHYYNKMKSEPRRLPRIAKILGIDKSRFSKTVEGFEEFTDQAERVIETAKKAGTFFVDHDDPKKIYYAMGSVEETDSIVKVIIYDGKIQSMMPSTWKQYNKDKSKYGKK